MAVPAVDFPIFPRLPAELRVQIWEETLPKFVRPLYFYRNGRWTVGNAGSENLDIKFDHLSPNMEINVPIFSVNREAFRVTRSWMMIHGIYNGTTPTKSTFFIRPFNPKVDTLYLSWSQFSDNSLGIACKIYTTSTSGNITINRTEPMCLAVSRDTVKIGPSSLEFLFQHPFCRATHKLVIVDNAEVLPNNNQELQHHWELNSALSTPAFVWNSARDRFEEGEGIGNSDPYLLGGLNACAASGMTGGFGEVKDHKLEVYLATAIKM
ncbi:hypothetical protein AbraIFM66951_005079 [Aspergillus brasiliensis]|uniref:2EXR domain-containing protein n=1 Tax=Aspergillus brasiliensis TaxID=319629 RepID=A0A9W5Z1J8_9EURO|nr:hypothetical protein AbraCBS73388_002000 [Aspergillus brasiliensis]GKZ51143.1 hypothetical protein AbraIFM66951_005079 [Aspergillus brasiliensis]